MIDVAAYRRRIGHEGPLAPTADVLRALQLVHLYAVPFENLDIHLGRPIVLSMDALERKVVGARRGGFCYELNGTFAELLRALGFGVSLLAAEVARGDGAYGRPFDHLALEVTAAGAPVPWLVDVGFGDGFLEPLPLVVARETVQANGTYRIDEEGGFHVLRRRHEPGGPFLSEYRFTRQRHELAEYVGMCEYHQTSPESHFTQRRVCSLATPDGRITLGQDRLVVTRLGERTEQLVPDDAAYRALLRERFGVEIAGDWVR
ncbi:MAG TPA: arylamine N-acetyltransferase [Candidatus Dormibacteraeota bacterium]|nr:arylamine N-acetyltransferase [Candidatus Dormibacteraeota bacterium]